MQHKRSFFLAGFLLLLNTNLLWAHGGGAPQLTDEPVGPYRLYVWTSPEPLRVGDMHITIGLTDSASDGSRIKAVSDAKVMLHFTRVGGETDRFTRQATLQDALGGQYYEADVEIAQEGNWQIEIDVEDAGVATFEQSVLPAHTINRTLIGVGALLFVLILFTLGIRHRNQGQSNQRQSQHRGALAKKRNNQTA